MCAWYGAHIAQGLPGALSTVFVVHKLYVRQARKTVSAGEAQRGETSERKNWGENGVGVCREVVVHCAMLGLGEAANS